MRLEYKTISRLQSICGEWDSKRNPIVSAEQFTGSLDEELTNQDMLDAEEEL